MTKKSSKHTSYRQRVGHVGFCIRFVFLDFFCPKEYEKLVAEEFCLPSVSWINQVVRLWSYRAKAFLQFLSMGLSCSHSSHLVLLWVSCARMYPRDGVSCGRVLRLFFCVCIYIHIIHIHSLSLFLSRAHTYTHTYKIFHYVYSFKSKCSCSRWSRGGGKKHHHLGHISPLYHFSSFTSLWGASKGAVWTMSSVVRAPYLESEISGSCCGKLCYLWPKWA